MKNSASPLSCLFLLSLLLFGQGASAQDDLMKALEKETPPQGPDYATSTFKSTRLINGHTVETRARNTLEFIISHRFGQLNSGAYNFFGLDEAHIRLGLDYGVTDRLSIGIGRSSYQKTADGFMKYKLLRQSSGTQNVPITLVLFASMAYKGENSADASENRPTVQRLTYVYQALLARKVNSKLSLQLMPTVVHRNYAIDPTGPNTMVALGVGGRYKITKRMAISGEYYYRFLSESTTGYYNSLAFGFDIETGGHVFQIHLTNSQGMIEKAFITDTTGDFFKGAIHLGFNISRSFNLGKKKSTPPGNW